MPACDLEKFAGEMMRRVRAGAAERQLAGIGPGVGDKLGDGIDRQGLVDDEANRQFRPRWSAA